MTLKRRRRERIRKGEIVRQLGLRAEIKMEDVRI
jgi:hypothetical protein